MSNPLAHQPDVLQGTKPRKVDVRDLLGMSREVILTHQGEEYRLRITSNRKLILTK